MLGAFGVVHDADGDAGGDGDERELRESDGADAEHLAGEHFAGRHPREEDLGDPVRLLLDDAGEHERRRRS